MRNKRSKRKRNLSILEEQPLIPKVVFYFNNTNETITKDVGSCVRGIRASNEERPKDFKLIDIPKKYIVDSKTRDWFHNEFQYVFDKLIFNKQTEDEIKKIKLRR
jgi:hypothetical protein